MLHHPNHTIIQVGGITLHPNDLLHGDANGVTTMMGSRMECSAWEVTE